MAMEDFETFEEPIDKELSSQIDFAKFFRGIWRRKWLIISLSLVFAIPFYFIAKNQVPRYRCRVVIQSKKVGTDEYNIFDGDTQAEIRSQSFTERMAAVLGLAFVNLDSVYKDFDEVFLEYHTTTNPVEAQYKIVIDKLGTYYLYRKDSDMATPVDSADVWEAVDTPRSINGISYRLNPNFSYKPGEFHFRIRPFIKGFKFLYYSVEKTFNRAGNFLVIELEDENPDLIPKLLNRIAEAYLLEIKRLKLMDSDTYRDMLSRNLSAAEENMKNSEEGLHRFYSQYPLSLDAEKKSLMNRLAANESALRDLPHQRRMLSNLLMKLENPEDGYEREYRRVVVHQLASFGAMTQEPELIIYRQNLENLEKEYDRLYSEFSAEHKDVINYAKRIQETQDKIIEFASNYRNILAEQESAQRKEKVELEAKLHTLPSDERRLMELERKKQVDEELFTTFYVEMKRLQVSGTGSDAGIRILDRAARPTTPVNPSKKRQVMLGSGLGLLFGLFLSIGLDIADRSLYTLRDVERYLNLPVLGTIPVVSFKDIPDFRDDQKALQIDRQLVTHDYSPTPVGEAYRALRTQLLFARGSERIRTLLITSISPEEGKSFTASNLAIIMAQQRTNTLLVDADLRRGVQHNTFSTSKDPGLTNYLSNKATLVGLVQPTHVPNLSVLSCGSLIPNPSELLGSMQMRRFVAEVKRKYDFIIFDAPPLDAATDSVVISTLVDAVVIVVKAGKTNRNNAKERLDIFNTVPANLVGVVMNGTEEANMKSSYSYYHY
ncbi:polysaccharide biosynthesis tyrosine autokinase [candidate division KSB1 bacterium]|nr:polysaccharide biosynthesis tyrosine autokinase [candidate division KSB1 bacterium]RQW10217.1 MAG: polysaccharide biosynthesis tyrosine autokinase [candidate division KSB1 bacterium]